MLDSLFIARISVYKLLNVKKKQFHKDVSYNKKILFGMQIILNYEKMIYLVFGL